MFPKRSVYLSRHAARYQSCTIVCYLLTIGRSTTKNLCNGKFVESIHRNSGINKRTSEEMSLISIK